ncbi:hypothetical protein QTI51_15005 [Variovorax sp. J22G73]|uniref:hypothetical protein n=1 Tax=unclassified Variovorax TaxID=663243 RepID=UPI000D5C8646|nr:MULTISPECIES: hypothetical protein [unclassified Variovorax]MDM0005172.1 hypothetical protein [Variovorax sp. J22R203]MDM0098588.1 hypothetical protein [Variovorax sp. J22G73]
MNVLHAAISIARGRWKALAALAGLCAICWGFYALGVAVAPLMPELRISFCAERGVMSFKLTGSPGRS